MRKPASYPHSAERYAEDVKRAESYLARRSSTKFCVIIHESTLSRTIAYAVKALGAAAAMGKGMQLAASLGATYGVREVREVGA